MSHDAAIVSAAKRIVVAVDVRNHILRDVIFKVSVERRIRIEAAGIRWGTAVWLYNNHGINAVSSHELVEDGEKVTAACLIAACSMEKIDGGISRRCII